MTEIKICGLRRHEDISIVNKYLPEYAGFVFAKSKRQVSIEYAAELISAMDNGIKSVGVFVNSSVGVVVNTVLSCGLNIVQLHGDENVEYIDELREKLSNIKTIDCPIIWKAYRVLLTVPKQLAVPQQMTVPKQMTTVPQMITVPLLDAFEQGNYGGTGKTFDWEIAANIAKAQKIVLAGGLNVQNVAEAIKVVKPMVVDVSSGVETDGWKDEIKVRDFISTVRNS
jgi:phosphoribosylanthranilate isomerase